MSDDYEVGHGKPPKASQFKKGQSGNPRGRRPKTERSITLRQMRRDVLKATETEIDASAPGQSGKMTVSEAIIWKQIEQALRGDHRSAKFIMELRREFTKEHMRLHPEVMELLETGEQMHANDTSEKLDRHAAKVFNEFRKLTRKV